MKRAIFYIDGFNLYYGIRKTKQQFLKWLNIQKLSEVILHEDAKSQGVQVNLSAVKFFTANLTGPKHPGDDVEDKMKHQNIYLSAVEFLDKTEVIHGSFRDKEIWCPNCKDFHDAYEEKRTDVNIASELLSDAYEDKFDFAYVVSGDSDFVRPIQIVAKKIKKRTVVVFPPFRGSRDLTLEADGKIRLKVKRLKKCILPYKIETEKGRYIYMPDKWAEDAPNDIMEQIKLDQL